MKIIYKASFALAVTFAMTSCSSIYMPNVPNTPMFERSGEVYLGAHVNPRGNVSGNAAVAVADHVAILANGSYVDYKGGNSEFKQYLYEGGIGCFTTFGHENPRVLEIYGGYGIGQSTDVDTRASTTGMDPVETREMDFDKVFLQVNYARRREQIRLLGSDRDLSYGTAIRGSLLRMRDFRIDGIDTPTEENAFVEPIFFTRMQLTKSLQLQQTSGFNIGILGQNDILKAGNAVFTLGLVFKFGGSPSHATLLRSPKEK